MGPSARVAESAESSSRKRKLYSSCDSCKLRRVKCDRESDDQPCCKCVEKGIHCTTAGPKRKRQRVGIRIQQAKELFGEESTRNPISPPPEGRSSPSTDSGHDEASAHLSISSPENSLSLSELVAEVGSHLFDVSFTLIKYPFPLYRWEHFRKQFDAAGRRPEQMSSAMGEVLATTIIAYGARASSHQAILGPDAPSLSQIDVVEGNLIDWGRRRSAICDSLKDRAVRRANEKGAFTEESNESIVALLLLEVLLDHGDPMRRKGRPYRATALSHARTLSEDDGPGDEFMELQQGGLGWMIHSRDAFGAAMAGREPRLRDRDVHVLCGRKLPRGLPTIADLTRAFNGPILVWDPVIQVFDHIITVTRGFALRMAKETPFPEPRDDPFTDKFLWDFLSKLDETRHCVKEMQRLLAPHFTQAKPGYQCYKFYCQLMQLCCIQHVFLVHRAAQRESRSLDSTSSHAILLPCDETSHVPSPRERRRSVVAALKKESSARMGVAARELAVLLFALQNDLPARTGLGIMTGISLVYEALPLWAETLCGLPTADEGGPEDYTLDMKIQEVEWLLSAFRSLGWAWADMAESISYVERQHENLIALRTTLRADGRALAIDAHSGTHGTTPRTDSATSSDIIHHPGTGSLLDPRTTYAMRSVLVPEISYIDFQSLSSSPYAESGRSSATPLVPENDCIRQPADSISQGLSLYGFSTEDFLGGMAHVSSDFPSLDDFQSWGMPMPTAQCITGSGATPTGPS